ncbi:Uncharacterised protein [Mycobacteroides abscessus subsp. abscessus]|nr:Uncharacterised protein [Mycobacteroides abscessus subsp. abscessus]
MCNTLRCWRLYSWIRLTWMSNIQLGSRSTPVVASTYSASRALLRRLTSRHCVRNEESSAYGSSSRSRSRSATQLSPMASSSSSRSPGLASARKRRGVTPLVLLLNRCGHSS